MKQRVHLNLLPTDIKQQRKRVARKQWWYIGCALSLFCWGSCMAYMMYATVSIRTIQQQYSQQGKKVQISWQKEKERQARWQAFVDGQEQDVDLETDISLLISLAVTKPNDIRFLSWQRDDMRILIGGEAEQREGVYRWQEKLQMEPRIGAVLVKKADSATAGMQPFEMWIQLENKEDAHGDGKER